MTPRILILRAPGTNCDQETAFAFETAGGRADVVHLNRLLENPRLAQQYQVLCLPGGFSYGDDLSAGRIFANQMRHHLRDHLEEFKAAGKLILGVCNGFQVLIKSGVLLPDRADEPIATLTLNDSGKFEDRWVHLHAAGERCVFLRGIETMYLPVAHAEGKFVTRDAQTLSRLDAAGQLVLRYSLPPDSRGSLHDQSRISLHDQSRGSLRDPQPPPSEKAPAPSSQSLAPCVPYPANPNGAQFDVAGVCDETGRVLGLMPHPERHIDPTHHPRWTREQRERGDGLAVFENAVAYFQ